MNWRGAWSPSTSGSAVCPVAIAERRAFFALPTAKIRVTFHITTIFSLILQPKSAFCMRLENGNIFVSVETDGRSSQSLWGCSPNNPEALVLSVGRSFCEVDVAIFVSCARHSSSKLGLCARLAKRWCCHLRLTSSSSVATRHEGVSKCKF